MSGFIILKNRQLMGVFESGIEARRAVLQDLQKSPRATYEVARLVRRIRGERVPPRYEVVEEDFDA